MHIYMTHCINVTSSFSAFDLSCYTQPSAANLMSNFVNQVVEELSKVEGLSKILVAEHEAYKGFLPGNQKNILIVTQGFTNECTCIIVQFGRHLYRKAKGWIGSYSYMYVECYRSRDLFNVIFWKDIMCEKINCHCSSTQ